MLFVVFSFTNVLSQFFLFLGMHVMKCRTSLVKKAPGEYQLLRYSVCVEKYKVTVFFSLVSHFMVFYFNLSSSYCQAYPYHPSQDIQKKEKKSVLSWCSCSSTFINTPNSSTHTAWTALVIFICIFNVCIRFLIQITPTPTPPHQY